MSTEIEFLINKMKLLETTEPTKIITVETKIHPLIAATKELCYEGVISNIGKELEREREQITHDIIEARMSPKAYRQAIATGESEGVLVGYEFEICVPNKNYQKAMDKKSLLQAIFKHESVLGAITIDETDDIAAGELTPDTLDGLMIPINNPNLASFAEANDQYDLIGFGLPFTVKKFYPNKTTTHIENNIFEYFDFPSIDRMIKVLEMMYGRRFDKSYFKELELNNYEYKFASNYVKPLIEKTMSADTIVFSDYHQKEKNMTSWYIEPDSSIMPNGNDAGVEVVSPPLPAKQSITDLKKFFELARQENWYASKKNKTGLHINVSIPKEIDALKLAVFLGDQYVLKQFDRENNDYAISVIQSLKDYEPYPYQTTKNGYQLNQQILQNTIDSITDDHYASISIENSKYVSFRHVGGDYLTEEQDILNTVGRFVRAMIIASDPNMYRDEYLKKLTKLFALPKKPGTEPSDLEIVRTTLNDIRKNGLPIVKVGVVSITEIESSTFLRNLINNNMPVVPSAVLLSGTVDTTDTAFNFVMSKPNLPMLSPVPQMKANKDKVFNYYSEYLPKLDDWALRKILEKKGIDTFYSSPGRPYIVRYLVDFLPPTDPRTQRYYNEYLKKYYKEIKFNRDLMSGKVKMQTDESLGLGYPGTYEQEYSKFKSKGQQRNVAMTNEALDSAYEYRPGKNPGNFYFNTDDGQEYKVEISPSGGVVFYARGQGDEHKLGITGKGDSRKIFGTVINIVKDYVNKNNPKKIYFLADNSEPSRVKLYKAFSDRVGQVLPNYTPLKPINTGYATEFMLQRKDIGKVASTISSAIRWAHKRKDTELTEALDSSYDYQVGPDGRYYFVSDKNIKYRVTLVSSKLDTERKSVEVLFSSERVSKPGYTTKLTGTGDSYAVMGTIVKIVKDYVENNTPENIHFSAISEEPSRIKLYDRLSNMVARALPDYTSEPPQRLAGETRYTLRRKENISEALDSSYPYEGNANDGRYHFETEDGVLYKVYLQGKDLVGIAFSALLPGDEEDKSPGKTTITGTGNSRKIFGTVVKIVQDYVDTHKPKVLYFTAHEPSRVKLYNTMISQADKALPDYYASKPIELGPGAAYMLKRKDTNLTEAGQAPIYYFAYGMLTDPQIMHGVDMVGPAELKNFEYQMHRYANVAPKGGSSVQGVLWEIDRDFLSYLDQIEGYPQLYDRRTYPVYVDGQKYVAEVYVMTPATINHMKGSTPDGEYLRSIVSGYRNAGISTDQLKNSLRKK